MPKTRRPIGVVLACIGALVRGPCGAAQTPPAPLVLEQTIALSGVGGRIDHMAIDPVRNRLIVAALGNGTVEIIDLGSRQVVRRITGLPEPQGVAYVPGADLIVVASAGDGSVRWYGAGDAAPAGTLPLGSDADNVRLDPRSGHVIVGYGSGGLAVLDPGPRTRIGNVPLAAHPEGFQLDPASGRAFVNVPDAGQIAVVDLQAGRQVDTWRIAGLRQNFPMALEPDGPLLATVFRRPARLVLIDRTSGASRAQLETCGDSDDVFFDARRHRIYVSCGEGAIDVFDQVDGAYRRAARVATASGARTSLFVAELDRLFVARRAGLLGGQAAILVFRPVP
jgi:DNA-binding beta-propeller fold protein YncE